MSTVTLVAAVLIALGLIGVVVPLLPGPVLVFAGIAVWAYDQGTVGGWVVLGLATVVLGVGAVLKYALPGRRLREAGVPWATLAIGFGVGVVGFFVIPVIGLPIGFVLGVYLAELGRLGSSAAAWPSTKRAVAAVGLSMLIEFTAGLVAAAIWLLAAIFL
jgi:uncharacterized protein YqgC (DUF456 family)